MLSELALDDFIQALSNPSIVGRECPLQPVANFFHDRGRNGHEFLLSMRKSQWDVSRDRYVSQST